jgi:hypothetical protein
LPDFSPPIKTSSTSTRPDSRSRPGRTIARRSLCSQVPGRRVAAQPQRALQPQRADPVLLVGYQPDGLHPLAQRFAGVLEDRSGSHRHLAPTLAAQPEATPHPPSLGMPTLRTPEALTPADRFQIGQAVPLGLETLLKSGHGLRIVHPPDTTSCSRLSQLNSQIILFDLG